jgi:membrane protease YdiL (CAAX protease family)
LIGLFCFNGLAEEIVWRGFLIRRLNDGRPCRTAVLLMPFIAAAHIPILIERPGGRSWSDAGRRGHGVPFSYLYAAGGRAVWAPARCTPPLTASNWSSFQRRRANPSHCC